MGNITLYDLDRSGNCYKIRLMLSMLGLDYQRVVVDLDAGESLTPEFRRLNPRGQIPVLVDDGEAIWDSLAILVYLARRYGDEQLYPNDPLGEARVAQWLALSENDLLYGLARARVTVLLNKPFDLDRCHQDALPGVKVIEQQLTTQRWLAADHPTIADIACYPYLAVSEDGNFSMKPYRAIGDWIGRFESLPGWVPMYAR